MIYTIVKNALVGKQLSSSLSHSPSLSMIIPIQNEDPFYHLAWADFFKETQSFSDLDFIFMASPDHAEYPRLEEFLKDYPRTMLVSASGGLPSALEELKKQSMKETVVIADPQVIARKELLSSLEDLALTQDQPYFVLPQISKQTVLGEAVESVAPNLSLVSIFGFRKFRKNISHPLLSLSKGWLCLNKKIFLETPFHRISHPSLKLSLAELWEEKEISYGLAFGEKNLLCLYPRILMDQLLSQKQSWERLWKTGERSGFALYLLSLFIWSFPILCFFTHPYWSVASFLLLSLYRFFSKIVFQTSLRATFLHPIACSVWLVSLGWWLVEEIRKKYLQAR